MPALREATVRPASFLHLITPSNCQAGVQLLEALHGREGLPCHLLYTYVPLHVAEYLFPRGEICGSGRQTRLTNADQGH